MPGGYYRLFVVGNVEEIYMLFDRILIHALEHERRGVPGIPAAKIRAVLVKFMDGLDLIARDTAVKSELAIIDKIKASASGRPATGRLPGLAGSISSNPLLGKVAGGLPTGAVGIASLTVLNKGTLRYGQEGYGPYWRAQEYGFRWQPRNSGRVGVRGFFQPGGVPASQAMSGVHPTFEPGRGPLMRPQRPLAARHFLRDGAAEARADYFAELTALGNRIVAELATLGAF